MSDAAHRIYVDALSYCGDMPEPTGYLTNKEAAAFVKSRGKAGIVIKELVDLNAWEDLPDGFMIHDFPDYLPQTSRDRTRRWRDAKRASQGRHGDVTEASQPSVTEMSQGVTAHARAVPVPDPVPVPDKASSVGSFTPLDGAALRDALSNGHEEDLGLQLAVRLAELIKQPQPSAHDLSVCGYFIDDFAYLSVDDMVERARDHIKHCKSVRPALPLPRTISGFRKTLLEQNDHFADERRPKAWRPDPIAGDLPRLTSARDRDPDE